MRGGERSRRRSRTPVVAGGRFWLRQVHLKRTARDEQSGSPFHHTSSSRAARRATLDQPSGSQLTGCGPTGAGSLTSHPPVSSRTERQRRSGIAHGMKHCHPGAAQQSPGSITANEAGRGATLLASLRRRRLWIPAFAGMTVLRIQHLIRTRSRIACGVRDDGGARMTACRAIKSNEIMALRRTAAAASQADCHPAKLPQARAGPPSRTIRQ